MIITHVSQVKELLFTILAPKYVFFKKTLTALQFHNQTPLRTGTYLESKSNISSNLLLTLLIFAPVTN